MSPFDTIQIRRDLRANLNKEHVLPDEELAEPVLALSKDEAEADDVAEDSASSSKKPRQTVTKVPPLMLPPQTPRETRRADPSTHDDQQRPTKMRAVLIEIHFYFGSNIKFLFNEKQELKTWEMEQKVVAFFDTQGLLNEVFEYSFKK